MGLAPRTTAAALLLVGGLSGAATLATAAAAAPAVQPQAGAAAVDATAANTFDPATLTVKVGTKVTWTNKGGFHTVWSGDGSDPSKPDGPMNGSLTSDGATYEFTFTEAGTFPYFCQPHVSLGMKGEVVVEAAGGVAPTGPAAGPSGAPTASGSAAPSATASQGAAPAAGSGTPIASPTQEPDLAEIPGVEGNPQLERIEAARAAKEDTKSGFLTLLGAASAAMLVLMVAVFASTRPRRSTPAGR